MKTLDEELAERTRALIALDMDYVRKMLPLISEHGRLIGMHKARYEATDIPAELRHASGLWLRERNYSRMGGLPLLPEGELPTSA